MKKEGKDLRPIVGEPVLDSKGNPICPGCGVPFCTIDGVTTATVLVKINVNSVNRRHPMKSNCEIIPESIGEIERYHCNRCYQLLAKNKEDAERVFKGYQFHL